MSLPNDTDHEIGRGSVEIFGPDIHDPVFFVSGGDAAAAERPDPQLLVMREGLPLSAITSFLGIVLVIVFFVTSSDFGLLVIDTITAGGKAAALATAISFAFVLLGMCVAIWNEPSSGRAGLQGA